MHEIININITPVKQQQQLFKKYIITTKSGFILQSGILSSHWVFFIDKNFKSITIAGNLLNSSLKIIFDHWNKNNKWWNNNYHQQNICLTQRTLWPKHIHMIRGWNNVIDIVFVILPCTSLSWAVSSRLKPFCTSWTILKIIQSNTSTVSERIIDQVRYLLISLMVQWLHTDAITVAMIVF